MIGVFALAGVFWLLGFVFLWRVPVCRLNTQPATRPRVSVIIPARDEEKNLQNLLPSLTSQDVPPDEIIVVDDHSQDRTAEIARQAGARVVAAQDLPPGWLGKPWACQQGAEQASGEVLCFLDADTVVEPGGLRRMLDTLQASPGVLSVSPYHRTRTFSEQFSAFFNIMQVGGMNAFAVWGDKQKPAGLFGPCLFIRKSDYTSVGGHTAVKDKILENYSLGGPLAEKGVPLRLVGGRNAVSVRLYPNGLSELTQGWSKSFAKGAGQTPPLTMFMIIGWISGLIICTAFLIQAVALGWFSLALGWLAGYLLYTMQLAWHLHRIGRFQWYTSLFFPVFLGFFLAVFSWSAFILGRKKPVTWKGRDISGGQ